MLLLLLPSDMNIWTKRGVSIANPRSWECVIPWSSLRKFLFSASISSYESLALKIASSKVFLLSSSSLMSSWCCWRTVSFSLWRRSISSSYHFCFSSNFLIWSRWRRAFSCSSWTMRDSRFSFLALSSSISSLFSRTCDWKDNQGYGGSGNVLMQNVRLLHYTIYVINGIKRCLFTYTKRFNLIFDPINLSLKVCRSVSVRKVLFLAVRTL